MARISSGVYPCYENQFQINTFGVQFDNGVQEWHPFEHEGWVRRLLTAKAITLNVTAKRYKGDTGNDYVASLAWENGRDAETDFKWTFPDGTVVTFESAVINVTNIGSGDSTAVAPLEFEVLSNGKPTVTPPTP